MNNIYYVYIITNYRKTVLYTGVTNDLLRRVQQHRDGTGGVFAKRYRLKYLLFYEATEDVMSAIEREKEIKGWIRLKKEALISLVNPHWEDLFPKLLSN